MSDPARILLADGQGNRLLLINRSRTTFESDVYRFGATGVKKLDLPPSYICSAWRRNRLILSNRRAMARPQGRSLLAVGVAEGRVTSSELLFRAERTPVGR